VWGLRVGQETDKTCRQIAGLEVAGDGKRTVMHRDRCEPDVLHHGFSGYAPCLHREGRGLIVAVKDTVTWHRVFSQFFSSLHPCQYHPTNASHSSSSSLTRRTNVRSLRTFQRSEASRNTGTCFVLGVAYPDSGFPQSLQRRRVALSPWPCHSASHSARQTITRAFALHSRIRW
jgi:hypothetical protein